MANGLFGGGRGVIGDPFLVEDAADLNEVRNHNGAGRVFKQSKDIDLSGWDWDPIGSSYSDPFLGIYNGDNFKIKNLKVNKGGSYGVGLFGFTSGGIIHQVKLVGGSVTGLDRVGSLIGQLTGTEVLDCSSNVNVTAIGNDFGTAGGLIGRIDGYSENLKCAVQRSSASGKVSGAVYAGGLCGRVEFGDLTKNYATGEVTCRDSSVYQAIAGGLCGYVTSSNVWKCFATGKATATKNNPSEFAVVSCYAGGLCGYVMQSSRVVDSYARGNVIANSTKPNCFIGGLIGLLVNASAETSYSTGSVAQVPSLLTSFIGGLIGKGEEGFTITNGYFGSGPNNELGVSTSLRAYLEGFDFGSIWSLDSSKNDGYPNLQEMIYPKPAAQCKAYSINTIRSATATGLPI